MLLHPDRYWWLIPSSLVAAFLWQYWPMDPALRHVTPDAILLVSIYWLLRKPHRFNSLTAFTIGLFRDGIDGTMLGQHALAMVLASYAVHLLHQRLRLFAIWQQSLVIVVIATLYLYVCHWVHLVDRPASDETMVLLPALTTGLSWPLARFLLRLPERWHRLRRLPARA